MRLATVTFGAIHIGGYEDEARIEIAVKVLFGFERTEGQDASIQVDVLLPYTAGMTIARLQRDALDSAKAMLKIGSEADILALAAADPLFTKA